MTKELEQEIIDLLRIEQEVKAKIEVIKNGFKEDEKFTKHKSNFLSVSKSTTKRSTYDWKSFEQDLVSAGTIDNNLKDSYTKVSESTSIRLSIPKPKEEPVYEEKVEL